MRAHDHTPSLILLHELSYQTVTEAFAMKKKKQSFKTFHPLITEKGLVYGDQYNFAVRTNKFRL